MGRGENGLYLRCRARRVIESASRLLSTASMYFACFLAYQRASIRGTNMREKSTNSAGMASDESVGRRTLEREVSWAVFQFPRQIQ